MSQLFAQVTKVLKLQLQNFSFSLSHEYSGLISFRIDWFDILAVQESSPTPQFKHINSLVLSLLSFLFPHIFPSFLLVLISKIL